MENPYKSPQATEAAYCQKAAFPESVIAAVWRGITMGLKWTTYTAGLVFVLLWILLVAVQLALLISGKSAGAAVMSEIAGGTGLAVRGYLVSCLWGVPIGVIIWLIRYAVGR